MWPLYMAKYTIRGDSADLLLPIFSHIREAVWSGEWPWWNKYQLQGLPTSHIALYWNPVYLALGSLFSTPDRALNALYMGLVFISGLGFYKLSSLFLRSDKTATIAGLAYPITGFFVVHSPHFPWIEAAAWTPALLYLTIRYYRSESDKYLILLSFCFYLFSSAADPAFVLTLVFLFAGQAIYSMIRKPEKNRILGAVGIATLLTALLVWITYYQRWPLIPDFVKNPSIGDAPRSLTLWVQSLFLPGATVLGSNFGGTSTHLNLYSHIGIITVLLAGYVLWTTKDLIRRFNGRLILAFLTALIFPIILFLITLKSEGLSIIPFSRWILPLHLLTAGTLLLLGLRGLEKIALDMERPRRGYLFGGTGLIFMLMAFLGPDFYPSNIHDTLYMNYIWLDLWKGGFFLMTAGIILFFPRFSMGVLGSLLLLELGTTHLLIQDGTLHHPYPSEDFYSELRNPEDKVFVAELDRPIGGKTDQDFQIAGLNRNTGTLFKEIVLDGYWPWFPGLSIQSKDESTRQPWLRYPLFYISKDTSSMTIPDFRNFDPIIEVDAAGDHEWKLSILSWYEKYLVFNQNYHEEWKARLNGQWVPIHRTGTGKMKIDLPPGLHTIHLTFDSGGLIHVFWTTMLFFATGMVYLIRRKGFPYFATLACLPALILFIPTIASKKPVLTVENGPTDPMDTPDFHMNYESDQAFWFVRSEQITEQYSFDGYRSEALAGKREYSATLAIPRSALENKESLEFRFKTHHQGSRDIAVVLKIYSMNQDKYNIQYIESLNSGDWNTLDGHFPLEELIHNGEKEPLIKAEFYIWNYKKQDFIIDDIQLKLNP